MIRRNVLLTRIRVGLYLCNEAIEVLKQQDNMSRHVERLILCQSKHLNNFDDLVEKLGEIVQKGGKNTGNKEENNPYVKDKIISLLGI